VLSACDETPQKPLFIVSMDLLVGKKRLLVILLSFYMWVLHPVAYIN
jgi:hypothetical protein